MLLALIVASLVAAAAAANAEIKMLSFDELQSLKPVRSNATTFSPTQYLVTTEYKDGKTCTGDFFRASGVGFGTCMGGSGYSITYTAPVQDANGIKFTMNQFSTTDCTGPATYSIPVSYSFICYPTSGSGLKFSVVSSATPWEGLGEGVVGQIFADESVCTSGGGSDTFSFTKLNVCFEISNDGKAAAYDRSQMFSACDSSAVRYTQWDDNACTKNPAASSAPLTHCALSAAKDYQSVLCGSK